MSDANHRVVFNKILRRIRPRLQQAAVGLLVLVSATAAADAPPLSRQQVKALLEKIEVLRQEENIPAVGFTLVWGDQTLHAGALGIADVASGRKVNRKTRFRIGSITKAFTALAVLIAAQDELLTLDDRMIDVILDPPFDNPWRAQHPVTIAQLLEHTAGFQDMTWDEFRYSDPRGLPLNEALALFRDGRSVMWRPGKHSSYSNLGAGLTGLILERVSGDTFENYVTRQVLEPLGMSSASWFLDRDTQRHLATGYQADGETVIPYWHMVFRPFGALNLNPRDMAPFLTLLLQRGQLGNQTLLDPRAISRMEIPATTLAAGSGLSYGYGLGNYQWQRDGHVFHGHGGDGDGYLAHFGYNRASGLGYFVVITVFSHPPLRRLRRIIEETIAATVPVPEAPAVASGDYAHLLGRYVEVTSRFPRRGDRPDAILELFQRDGRMLTRIGDGPERVLVPVSALHFRRPDQTIATIAAVKDGEGNIILQGDLGNYRRLNSH